MADNAMFALLQAGDRAMAFAGATPRPKPVPIVPVPADAPECAWRHPKHGRPVAKWPYHDAEGRLVGHAARIEFVGQDGKRDEVVLPITYCRISAERCAWRACALPAPRPLYNLPALLAAPDAPVIVCEGEKKADAVPRLFPGCIGTTSMQGSNAPHKSDWTPLARRPVTIWPDNDAPGRQYAKKVAALTMPLGMTSVAIVEVPPGWPEGWDLADPMPDGGGPEVLTALLSAARPWVPPVAPDPPVDGSSAYVSFGPYQMNAKGLFFDSGKEDAPVLWLSAPFEVLAQTRNALGSDWGLLLRWEDPDGRAHEWAMPRETLGGRGDELWRNLLRNGLPIASSATSRNKLADYLGLVRVGARARSVTRIGWHPSPSGPVFVLPDITFGEGAGERVIWQTEARNETFFNGSGSVEDWREQIGRCCVGNSRLVMAVSVAFAAPLLDLANEESGGFHLVGKSRSGKTVVLCVGGSVWGGGGVNGFIRTWRATANGLEGIAEGHSDGLLPLDEMGQVDPREAGEIAYMLANGAGKARAGRDGSARRPAQWRLLFLSSGELSLADKMAEAGKRVRAGQEVRLVDIPADAGAGMGIFENLHGAASPGEFAEMLREAAARCYGAPIRLYLDALTERLAADRDGLRALLETNRREFMAKHLPASASPQVRSVCGRFALVAAAGSLATIFGITGWPDEEAERAAGICFRAWLERRGSAEDQEIESGIRQVIRYLEEHGSSRFEPAWENGGEPLPNEVTTVTTAPKPWLPANRYNYQGGSQGNRGNRDNCGDAARVSGAATAAGIELNRENEETKSRSSGRTLHRAGFRRESQEGLWEYMALPEAWKTDITKGHDARALARAMVDRGLIIADPKRGTPAQQMYVPAYGKPRLYVFAPDILERYDDPGGGEAS